MDNPQNYINHQLNTSLSKQTYKFSTKKRFCPIKKQYFAYNLDIVIACIHCHLRWVGGVVVLVLAIKKHLIVNSIHLLQVYTRVQVISRIRKEIKQFLLVQVGNKSSLVTFQIQFKKNDQILVLMHIIFECNTQSVGVRWLPNFQLKSI